GCASTFSRSTALSSETCSSFKRFLSDPLTFQWVFRIFFVIRRMQLEEAKVYRALWILPLASLLCFAADNRKEQDQKPVVDSSNMSSDVHAPLFREPKVLDAGSETERLASGLPKPGMPSKRVPRRNFIDEHIFGKMEREGIPHAPEASDQEFF